MQTLINIIFQHGCLKSMENYGPGGSTTIKRPLRRTLVLLYYY